MHSNTASTYGRILNTSQQESVANTMWKKAFVNDHHSMLAISATTFPCQSSENQWLLFMLKCNLNIWTIMCTARSAKYTLDFNQNKNSISSTCYHLWIVIKSSYARIGLEYGQIGWGKQQKSREKKKKNISILSSSMISDLSEQDKWMPEFRPISLKFSAQIHQ